MKIILILFVFFATPHWVTEDEGDESYSLVEHYVMPSSRICGTVRKGTDTTVYEALLDASPESESDSSVDSKWEAKAAAEKRVAKLCNDKYPDDVK